MSGYGLPSDADIVGPDALARYAPLTSTERAERFRARIDALPESRNAEWYAPRSSTGWIGAKGPTINTGTTLAWAAGQVGSAVGSFVTETLPNAAGRAAGNAGRGLASGLGLPPLPVLLGGAFLLLLLLRK